MPKSILASFLVLSLPLILATGPKKAELKLGDMAPGFSLPDQDGKTHSLKDYAGKYVVLYFYPKDETPGCTTEACSFRDQMTDITAVDTVVLGVSADTVKSHKGFASHFNLNFVILADPKKKVIEEYGVLGPMGMAQRVTFIIDPAGKIAVIIPKVNPTDHAKLIIDELAKLRAGSR